MGIPILARRDLYIEKDRAVFINCTSLELEQSYDCPIPWEATLGIITVTP